MLEGCFRWNGGWIEAGLGAGRYVLPLSRILAQWHHKYPKNYLSNCQRKH
jgi:hypothetical protein